MVSEASGTVLCLPVPHATFCLSCPASTLAVGAHGVAWSSVMPSVGLCLSASSLRLGVAVHPLNSASTPPFLSDMCCASSPTGPGLSGPAVRPCLTATTLGSPVLQSFVVLLVYYGWPAAAAVCMAACPCGAGLPLIIMPCACPPGRRHHPIRTCCVLVVTPGRFPPQHLPAAREYRTFPSQHLLPACVSRRSCKQRHSEALPMTSYAPGGTHAAARRRRHNPAQTQGNPRRQAPGQRRRQGTLYNGLPPSQHLNPSNLNVQGSTQPPLIDRLMHV